MSTKIYDGCRASRSLDVFELADRVREVMIPLRQQLEAEEIGARAASLIDRELIAGVPRSTSSRSLCPVLKVCEEWDEEQKNLGEHHRLNDPFRFTMQIIPSGDHLYLLPYFEDRRYLDALIALDGVEHYPYWNNTDHPEELTEEQWEARGEEWTSVPGLDYGEIPAQHGVSVDLGMDSSPLVNLMTNMELVVKHQPSMETRMKGILHRVVAPLFPVSDDISTWMRHVRQVERAVKNARIALPNAVEGMAPLTREHFVGMEVPEPVRVDVFGVYEFVRTQMRNEGK